MYITIIIGIVILLVILATLFFYNKRGMECSHCHAPVEPPVPPEKEWREDGILFQAFRFDCPECREVIHVIVENR